jgi:hypothetical protein
LRILTASRNASEWGELLWITGAYIDILSWEEIHETEGLIISPEIYCYTTSFCNTDIRPFQCLTVPSANTRILVLKIHICRAVSPLALAILAKRSEMSPATAVGVLVVDWGTAKNNTAGQLNELSNCAGETSLLFLGTCD